MSFFRHFLALVRKNVQLKQRAFGSTFLELHLPVVFMALMLLLKRQFTTDVFSPRSHEDSATSIPPFFPLPAGLALSGSGGLLAVASSSSSGAAAAAAFFSHASAMYPPIPLGALGGGALAEVLPAEWRAAVLPGFNASAVAFPSEAALEAYIASQNYGRLGGPPPLYAAIVFNSGPPALDYTLRFNTSAVPYTQFFVNQWTNSFQNGSLLSYLSADAPSLDVNTASSLPPLPASGGYYPTLPGFLTLQTMVDRWAINASVAPAALDAAALLERFGGALLDVSALAFLPVAEALLQLNGTGRSAVAADLAAGGLRGETLAPQQIDVLPFPVGAYTQNIFYQAILSSLTLLFVLAWVYSVSTLIAALVDEKEKRMRESMLSMGLGQLALYSSWFATYAAMTLVVAAEISVVGVVLFPASSALLVFALFAAWGFSTITFCFLLSSFFTQAKVASVLGAALFILAFFSTYGLSETTPAASRVLYSLLCPAALDQAVMVLAALETDGVGLTASSLFSARVNDWTVGDSLRMLLLDTVLYGLLAAYADAVMPTALRDFGVPRPLYFPCTPRFWAREVCGCKAPRGSGITLVGHGEPAAPPAGADVALFDDLDGDGRTALAAERAITVRGLKKVFPSPDGGTLTAVAGLDLDIVEGQIFVLLGHNGAGKTTTLSMLTGMLPPTEGGARIYGKDLGSELGAIRAELGVCPQHDVLWPSLTVSEHLELFAALKGVPPERVATEAAASLAMVGLTEKLRAPVCTLSGGQKRKLSVCIAFLGGSRVVFLDEPTSGMDPYSRRSTWEILQNARAGRVIVLTTHFMDEADILGDRVGIMADGGLRCVGSPLFLKERYGLGYTVTAILKPASAAASAAAAHAPLLALAREHVADATLAGAAGCEVALRAPLAASTAFPALLRDLAGARGAALGVETAGVHVTSVEDVFLRVAHAEEARRGAGAGARADTPGAAAASPAGGSVEEVRAAARPRLSGGRAFATHFNAIFSKRLRYARRDYRAICCLLLMPVVSLCLGLGFLLRANWASGEPDMQLSTAQFNSASPTAPLGGGAPNRVPAFSFKAGEAVDSVDLASILGRFPNTTFDGGALQLGVAAAAALDTLNGTYGLCTAAENSTARAWQRMATLLLHDAPSFKESLYGAVVFLGADGTALKGQGAAAALNAASGNANITYSVMVNTTAQHAGPIFVNLANSALLQSSPGGGGAGASIATRSHPLPYTPFQAANVLATQGFAITQVLLLSLAFVTPAFIQFVVREREVKAKHQQLISGVSIPAYWAGNFAFDLASYVLPFALALITLKAFGASALLENSRGVLLALVALLAAYGAAGAAFSYALSHAFSAPGTAAAAAVLLNILQFAGVLALTVLGGVKTTCTPVPAITKGLSVLPFFALGSGLSAIARLDTLDFTVFSCDLRNGRAATLPPPLTSAFALRAGGGPLLYLLVSTAIYLAVAVAVDFARSDMRLRRRLESAWGALCGGGGLQRAVPAAAPMLAADADVLAEEARVDRLLGGTGAPVHARGSSLNRAPSQLLRAPPAALDEEVGLLAAAVPPGGGGGAPPQITDSILLSHLHKEFPRKVAVRDLSFGVPPGEVFGFLGINGAGKTTTLNMLTGDELCTTGTAFLAGFDIIEEQQAVRRLLGYCPQFDALLDKLTAREHLELYARIKGVGGKELASVVNSKLAEFDLTRYADKLAGRLSGGNKRKLSVAVALIGGPPLLFLDEPSTGVDPVAKRFMWKVLARVAAGRTTSIVLTSHSMEEVEALCTRIGIMVGGRLRCLGSPQHLRTVHGEGFTLDLRVGAPPPGAGDVILAALTAAGLPAALRRDAVPAAAAALGAPARAAEVSAHGLGWAVEAAFSAAPGGAIPAAVFTRWWAEVDAVDIALMALSVEFPGLRVKERHGLSLRLVAEKRGRPLADAFEALERCRARLHEGTRVTLGETSLEEIFNGFAAQQEEETGVARGMLLSPRGAL